MALKQGDMMTFHRDSDRGKPTITHLNTEGKTSMIGEHRRFEFNSTVLNEITDTPTVLK